MDLQPLLALPLEIDLNITAFHFLKNVYPFLTPISIRYRSTYSICKYEDGGLAAYVH